MSDAIVGETSSCHDVLHRTEVTSSHLHFGSSSHLVVNRGDRISNFVLNVCAFAGPPIVAAGTTVARPQRRLASSMAAMTLAARVQTEQQINGLTKATSAPIAVLAYFTLLAPGGNWPDGARESLIDKLRQNVSSDVWARLLAVRDAISTWSSSAELDPIETIAMILEALGGLDGTFIFEDKYDYPGRGSFIPRSMTQAQFESLGAN